LSAVAHDAAGNISTATTISVVVNNPVPDTTAPSVQITSPASGSTLAKNLKVTVVATDNVAVTRVDLFIDGKLYQSATASNTSFTWNTAKVTNGTHTLQAFAYDAAGNKGASAVVTVTK
jgi:hypothetical protein